MDEQVIKAIVKNAVRETLAKNMSPAARDYYERTMRRIESVSAEDDKRGLTMWLKDFLKAAPSIQAQLARSIDERLKELKVK